MTPFAYSRAATAEEALAQMAGGARCLGGGTNLVDLLRQNVEACDALVDVSRLPAAIEARADGGLLIGGAARNSAVAAHPAVRAHYPMLSRALLSGASAQIRNMATVAGNILQRPRCVYFYDPEGSRCNRRAPGSGCDAIGGLDRHHAILGASPECVAVHPSDMAVAMSALDADVVVEGAERTCQWIVEWELALGWRRQLHAADGRGCTRSAAVGKPVTPRMRRRERTERLCERKRRGHLSGTRITTCMPLRKCLRRFERARAGSTCTCTCNKCPCNVRYT